MDVVQPAVPHDQSAPAAIVDAARSAHPRGGYLAVKAAFDIACGAVLLIVAAPLILIVAAIVRLTSRGPAFYAQQRIGKDGAAFRVYKIRTMVTDSEAHTGPVWSLPRDHRVTRVGRILRATHLDELPQLLNIVRGEMSLIGPRPERPELMEKIEQSLPRYRERLAVRPGLTGLAQVHLLSDRNIESVRRKLAYDIYYVEHLTLGLDFRIFVGTLFYLAAVSADTIGKLLTFAEHKVIETQLDRERPSVRHRRPEDDE